MKKVFTLFALLTALCVANAQISLTKNLVDKSVFNRSISHNRITSIPHKHAQPNGRSATTVINIDYKGVDDAYATLIGTSEFYDPTLLINKNWTNTDNLTQDYAVALFDSLLYLDGNNLPAFLPRHTTTLTLDSIDIFFIHKHAVTNTHNDSIHITVFDRDSLKITGTGPTGAISQNRRWDTLIVTNTEIPLNVSNGGTPTFTGITVYPNLPFVLGKTFGVRVDFAGDTANHFSLISSFRDDCANACVAAPSAANDPNGVPNSLYYINATAAGPPAQNLSGINTVGFNCGPPCAEWTAQNWWVFPWVTANTSYSAAIVSDSLKGCPGTVLNLSAFGFGSTATPLTYTWASTSGSFSTTTDQNVSYIVGNSGTVTVTVTDANNATVSASVNIVSKGITVAITNPSPVNLACGSSATISTSLTGTQTGKNYIWSTSATGANAFSISVNRPGTYSVTVTNNVGCSSSATVSVVYPGVSNTVSFNPPPPPICKGATVTFTNTSTQQGAGWTPSWDMGNGDLVNTPNAIYSYATAGGYAVKLTMDSASCAFSYTRNVNVSICSGIEDVEFGNAITLQPNPSTGNVTITVNGIDKNLSVSVYNVIGSEVKTFSTGDVTSTFSKSFDFSDLSNGTYLMKIQSSDKVAVKRFTISK